MDTEILLVRYEATTQYFSGISVLWMTVDMVSDNRTWHIRKIKFVKVEMWFQAVYYLFVFITVFNIFGQEHLHKIPL